VARSLTVSRGNYKHHSFIAVRRKLAAMYLHVCVHILLIFLVPLFIFVCLYFTLTVLIVFTLYHRKISSPEPWKDINVDVINLYTFYIKNCLSLCSFVMLESISTIDHM
jgi:hypothetical protein